MVAQYPKHVNTHNLDLDGEFRYPQNIEYWIARNLHIGQKA